MIELLAQTSDSNINEWLLTEFGIGFILLTVGGAWYARTNSKQHKEMMKEVKRQGKKFSKEVRRIHGRIDGVKDDFHAKAADR